MGQGLLCSLLGDWLGRVMRNPATAQLLLTVWETERESNRVEAVESKMGWKNWRTLLRPEAISFPL